MACAVLVLRSREPVWLLAPEGLAVVSSASNGGCPRWRIWSLETLTQVQGVFPAKNANHE